MKEGFRFVGADPVARMMVVLGLVPPLLLILGICLWRMGVVVHGCPECFTRFQNVCLRECDLPGAALREEIAAEEGPRVRTFFAENRGFSGSEATAGGKVTLK